MRARKEPTATGLVFDALRAADDFLTLPALRVATGLDTNHVSAALCHLRKYRAVAAIAEGSLWWYATPEDDTRLRRVEERTPERRPRSPRRRRAAARAVAA
jgi:hypothetical protein